MTDNRPPEALRTRSMARTVIRKGAEHFATRARYGALARRFTDDVPLHWVEMTLAGWHTIAAARLAKGKSNGAQDDRWREKLREARLILRFLRRTRRAGEWPEILAAVKARTTDHRSKNNG